jgi:hypothetical protein
MFCLFHGKLGSFYDGSSPKRRNFPSPWYIVEEAQSTLASHSNMPQLAYHYAFRILKVSVLRPPTLETRSHHPYARTPRIPETVEPELGCSQNHAVRDTSRAKVCHGACSRNLDPRPSLAGVAGCRSGQYCCSTFVVHVNSYKLAIRCTWAVSSR